MKIEEGKIYRTRDGRKVGPIDARPAPHDGFPFGSRNEAGFYELYTRDGFVVVCGKASADAKSRLVAEWEEPDATAIIRQMREALAAALPILLTAEEHPSLTARIGKAETALARADEFLKA